VRPAAVAGFLLTAVATWTGRPPLSGWRLGMLVVAWLVGRLAMMFPLRGGPALSALADLVFPVLLLAIGGAIDFGYMYVRQSSLQAAADAAALASAKELQLANADEDAIKEIAKATVIGNLKDIGKGVTVDAQVSFDARTVTVNASQRPGLYILGGMAGIEEFDISAHATARVAGDMPICMLVLDDDTLGYVPEEAAETLGERLAGRQRAHLLLRGLTVHATLLA